jgi:hypothetical protein
MGFHSKELNGTNMEIKEHANGTPASSTTKTGRYDIAEILLKVVLKHKKSNF